MDEYNAPLREMFEKIDASELAAMKARREEEGLNLDFKRMDPSGEPSDSDKKNLREAISGYANAAGGIILWGVESKSAENKGDRSRFQGIVPVKDGERAAVRFHELTAVATQPAVSGVVHRAIPVAGGFVVKTFVPSSDGGPHRTNEEKGQYFRRDADAFRAMQHHEIADMFGRRARPRIELRWERVIGDTLLESNGVQCAWILALGNVGRGLARFPGLLLRVRPGLSQMGEFGLDTSGDAGLPRKRLASSGLQMEFFAGRGDDVIHPGQDYQVTRIGLYRDQSGVCIVDYRIYAEGMPVVSGAFKFWTPGGIAFGDDHS